MLISDWDFYLCRVEDKRASFYLDLNASKVIAASKFSFMAYIRVVMNQPREDGLSSQEEYEALDELEQAMERELKDSNTNYVGRCTTNSRRDYFFYIMDDFGWGKRVADFMDKHQTYQFETDVRSDPDWLTYHSYLFPSAVDHQSIRNRRVCDLLESNGDKLELTREIEHWAYFNDEVSRNSFVIDALKIGFFVRELYFAAESANPYCVQIWRSDIPDYPSIDDITRSLCHLAVSHRGEYDGWESQVIE